MRERAVLPMPGTERSMCRMHPRALDLAACRDWFCRNRARSRAWFDLLTDAAYLAQPIALRHPIVFYEGHVAAFNVNTLVKRALGLPGVDEELEQLFERGIDPDECDAAASREVPSCWPSRSQVLEFAAAADASVDAAFGREGLVRDDHPLLRRGLVLFTILEHEAMHHETLLYMFHRLPAESKRRPAGYRPVVGGEPPPSAMVEVPAGMATLGADPDLVVFAWDNELPAQTVDVPSFRDRRPRRHEPGLSRVREAGGYADRSLWTADDWAWREREGIRHPSFWIAT